jgi:hypothetical protein
LGSTEGKSKVGMGNKYNVEKEGVGPFIQVYLISKHGKE